MNTTPIAHIPHLVIGGRPYFSTAKDRDAAAKIMELPVGPVDLMEFNTRENNSRVIRWHWRDSQCTVRKWKYVTEAVRARTVDGWMFDRIHEVDRCAACHEEFMEA